MFQEYFYQFLNIMNNLKLQFRRVFEKKKLNIKINFSLYKKQTSMVDDVKVKVDEEIINFKNVLI